MSMFLNEGGNPRESDVVSVKKWVDNIPITKIKEIRKSMGMSQVTMGKLLGVSSTTVSRWECGERPSFRNASFLKLFEEFTKQYSVETGEIARLLARHGEPRALYRVLDTIYASLETKQKESNKEHEPRSNESDDDWDDWEDDDEDGASYTW